MSTKPLKRAETIINVGIVVVAVLIAGVLVKRYFFPADPRHSNSFSKQPTEHPFGWEPRLRENPSACRAFSSSLETEQFKPGSLLAPTIAMRSENPER